MSTNNKRNLDDQEIDLLVVSNKIRGFFQSINMGIFKSIRFMINHVVILGILLLIGIGLGTYLDKTDKIYDNQIIVQPNFGSTDYLYSKVELLASKLQQRDTVFLKSIGFEDSSNLLSIKIEPVVDIYKFISGNDKSINEQNFELLKLMAEDGDMKKVVEEKITSKNYAYHTISFVTNKLTSRKDIIEPLTAYLNNSLYFNQVKAVYMQNEQTKIQRNNEIIAQIDQFLNSYAKADGNTKSDKLIYYNENTQLNDVIQTKNALISEIGRLQLSMVSIDKIIKISSSSINIQNTKSINGKRKMIFPVLFVLLYMFMHFFINFYKSQAAKINQSK